MFKHRLGFILIPIVVVIGFANYLVYQYIQAKRAESFTPKLQADVLTPPNQAVIGTITMKNGIVLQKTRESTDYHPASSGNKILQSESVSTQLGSAKLTFEEIGNIFLGNNSEITAINLIPKENAFLQKTGTVQYESTAFRPVSVRALHTLCEISGEAAISISGSTINIRVTKGSANLALVDRNNNTKVWKITQDHQATSDDDSRRVTVR